MVSFLSGGSGGRLASANPVLGCDLHDLPGLHQKTFSTKPGVLLRDGKPGLLCDAKPGLHLNDGKPVKKEKHY